MITRAEYIKLRYHLYGELQIALSEGIDEKINSLSARINELNSDLIYLRKTPESDNYLEELHLRLLAKLRINTIDKYKIVGYVGAGQCGVVYKAEEIDTKLKVALKLLLFPRNTEERDRFIDEGNVTFNLQHSAIVKGITPTRNLDFLPASWYVMELLENATPLESFIENYDLSKNLIILSKVCNGLDHAHQNNVIHRDLHLNNILILENDFPKILDFGAAKFSSQQITFRPIGCLVTASPEKIIDSSNIDGKSDVFSIGCILYKIITGRWPFISNNYGEFILKILKSNYNDFRHPNKAVSELIKSVLIVNPKDRPTAKELSKILINLADEVL